MCVVTVLRPEGESGYVVVVEVEFAFLIKVTRNRGRVSKWVCPFGALLLVVNCLTLMTLKPKPSRLLEISSAGVSGGR
jgi:hypothetical protein